MFWCCSSGVIRQTQREGQVKASKRMVEGLAKDTSGWSRENVERCDGCPGSFGGSPITCTQIGVTLWVCNAFSSRRWSLIASEGSDDASAFRCFLDEFLTFSVSSEYWSLMKVANVRALLLTRVSTEMIRSAKLMTKPFWELACVSAHDPENWTMALLT